jgi:hypothetical protein
MLIRSGLLLALLLEGSFPVTAEILYTVRDLGTLGGSDSLGYGLNNAGQVTGYSPPWPAARVTPFSPATGR